MCNILAENKDFIVVHFFFRCKQRNVSDLFSTWLRKHILHGLTRGFIFFWCFFFFTTYDSHYLIGFKQHHIFFPGMIYYFAWPYSKKISNSESNRECREWAQNDVINYSDHTKLLFLLKGPILFQVLFICIPQNKFTICFTQYTKIYHILGSSEAASWD